MFVFISVHLYNTASMSFGMASLFSWMYQMMEFIWKVHLHHDLIPFPIHCYINPNQTLSRDLSRILLLPIFMLFFCHFWVKNSLKPRGIICLAGQTVAVINHHSAWCCLVKPTRWVGLTQFISCSAWHYPVGMVTAGVQEQRLGFSTQTYMLEKHCVCACVCVYMYIVSS